MSTVSNVKGKVFSLPEYAKKGYNLTLKDSFLFNYEDKPYIVFIATKSSFTVKNAPVRYSYAVYSVKDDAAISVESDEYKSITAKFPPVDGLSRAGAKPNFDRRFELEDKFDELAGAYCDNCGLNEQEKTAYAGYLDGMAELASPTFKEIYKFFLEHI